MSTMSMNKNYQQKISACLILVKSSISDFFLHTKEYIMDFISLYINYSSILREVLIFISQIVISLLIIMNITSTKPTFDYFKYEFAYILIMKILTQVMEDYLTLNKNDCSFYFNGHSLKLSEQDRHLAYCLYSILGLFIFYSNLISTYHEEYYYKTFFLCLIIQFALMFIKCFVIFYRMFFISLLLKSLQMYFDFLICFYSATNSADFSQLKGTIFYFFFNDLFLIYLASYIFKARELYDIQRDDEDMYFPRILSKKGVEAIGMILLCLILVYDFISFFSVSYKYILKIIIHLILLYVLTFRLMNQKLNNINILFLIGVNCVVFKILNYEQFSFN